MRIIIDIHKYYIQYILGNESYLDKAYNVAKAALEKHPAHAGLYLYTAFLEVEKGNTATAVNMLTSFKPYANFYKDQEPYAVYNFLLGITDPKNIQKYKEAILDCENDYSRYICYMYIKSDPGTAYTYLDRAFSSGCRSPFLYLCFYEIFKTGRKYYKSGLLIYFLKWANAHNLLTLEMLGANFKLIFNEIQGNVRVFTEIYEKLNDSSTTWLLTEICKAFSSSNDYSMTAYKFYNKLAGKQIYKQEFNNALVYSAYINNIEDVGRFSVENFIQQPIEMEIRPFIFHLLLTLPHLEGLVNLHDLSKEIIVLALHGASTDISPKDRRYYNTLFCYALQHNNGNYGSLNAAMEESILDSLFVYKLTVTNVKVAHVWVSEQTKAEPISYQIKWHKGRGTALIRVSSKYFRILCLDRDKKNIIEEEPELQRQVQEDYWLYNYFYKKGKVSTELLTALSSHYINEGIENEECVNILSRTIKVRGLSRHFRLQAAQTLGNVLFKLNHREKALEYYKEVDTHQLNPGYIEIMFKVFMANEEYQKAVKLIQDSSQNITEITLQEGINTLLKAYQSQKRHSPIFTTDIRPIIVNAIYELLIKGFYSEILLQTALNFYKGSIMEWCQLSDVLREQHISNIQLDERILKTSIYMRHISPGVLKVFLRLYSSLPNSSIAEDFVYYLCYKTIIEKNPLTQDIIDVLKQIYSSREDVILLTALSILVIESQDEDDKMILKETMNNLDTSGMFLPIFMEQAREHLTEHQQSLYCITYTADAGQNIYAYIKIGNGEEFVRVQMSYFRFGLYTVSFPIFYDESISYYFEENGKKSNSVLHKNDRVDIKHLNDNFELSLTNEFFAINNAIIYLEMFKHDEMEKLLYNIYQPKEAVSYKLL